MTVPKKIDLYDYDSGMTYRWIDKCEYGTIDTTIAPLRCKLCENEIKPNTRYCLHCGFDQTCEYTKPGRCIKYTNKYNAEVCEAPHTPLLGANGHLILAGILIAMLVVATLLLCFLPQLMM